MIERRLIDVLTKEITKAEFEVAVDGILTDDVRLMFGEKAKDLVIQSIIFPAAFAPFPATFDSQAYAFVIDDAVIETGYDGLIDTDRIQKLLWISLENGILETDGNGRFFVPAEVYEVIRPILAQYNGTDDSSVNN